MTIHMAQPLSRRMFLRGVGVTMALPWLESLSVWGDDKPKHDPSSEPPVRFACLFSGNGFHKDEWWAKGEGPAMELGKVLDPLKPFREKMLFLRGLYNEEALIGGIHSCQTGNLLTGAHLAPAGEIQIRHQLRPGPGGENQRPNESAEPRARHGAIDRGDSQELFDDLQFAYFVEFRHDADAAWNFTRPWHSTGSSATK